MNLIRDLFATLFFVAIGMLLERDVIIRDATPVAALLVILIVGKLLVVGGALLIAGVSHRISTLSAALLGQMGEFSFVLAGSVWPTGSSVSTSTGSSSGWPSDRSCSHRPCSA